MKYVASHVDAMDLVEDFLELGKEVPYLTRFYKISKLPVDFPSEFIL